MWVRQREPYSMYKRASSRDYMNTTDMESKEFVDTLDMEDNSGNYLWIICTYINIKIYVPWLESFHVDGFVPMVCPNYSLWEHGMC